MVFQAQYSEEPTLKGFYLFHRDLTFSKTFHTTLEVFLIMKVQLVG